MIVAIGTMGEDTDSTSMHLRSDAKSRFDSLKRQIEADRDEDLDNSDVLEILIESYEETATEGN